MQRLDDRDVRRTQIQSNMVVVLCGKHNKREDSFEGSADDA